MKSYMMVLNIDVELHIVHILVPNQVFLLGHGGNVLLMTKTKERIFDRKLKVNIEFILQIKERKIEFCLHPQNIFAHEVK
jgi:creatinine amidohydrolase/Fe(II)-dependent formamide hydrolase-like protein